MTAMSDALRRYTFKLYPNASQTAALERQRALHSALYNALIQQRIEAWSRGQWTLAPTDAPRVKRGRNLTAFDQGKEVTALRAADPEYAALSRGSMEQTVKRVDLAFQAFFRRAKQGAGAAAGFPRYKRVEGFGMREAAKGGWSFADNRLRIQGIPGTIKARGRFPGEPTGTRTCELMLREGAWWLSIVVEMPVRMTARADHHSEVRMDLLDSFARIRRVDGGCAAGPEETVFVAADGRIILDSEGDTSHRVQSPSERGVSAGGDGISHIQQAMARCKRGSNRYRKLRHMKAKREAREARRRREELHVWTTETVRDNAELTVIAPKIKPETASGAGTKREWGAHVETKAMLNRRVLQQAPATAVAMLEYKMAERGGSIQVIEDTAPSINVGNDLVAAGKATRKARRQIKRTEHVV